MPLVSSGDWDRPREERTEEKRMGTGGCGNTSPGKNIRMVNI